MRGPESGDTGSQERRCEALNVDFTTFILAMCAFGVSALVLGYVYATRQAMDADLDARDALRAEFQATLHVITEGHNKLVSQLAETADRVSDLSLRTQMVKK